MRALDLFSGAGGAAMGLHRAGFEVAGVDIAPQPRYPFRFIQADALTFDLSGFDFVWASPPCQRYCAPSQYNHNRETYPDLIDPIRQRLMESGLPFIIENVPGSPLREDAGLCGQSFGLRVYRHRLFESNIALASVPHLPHFKRCARNGYLPAPDENMTVTGGKHSRAWVEAAKWAMGVPWMETVREVCEAIPPAYSEYLGRQVIAYLERMKEQAA